MSGHEIVKCRACDAVIAQCRCPGPHPVRYVDNHNHDCKPSPAPGEPKEGGKGPRCPECGYCDILPIEDSPTDRPVAANKTMGREFAKPFETGDGFQIGTVPLVRGGWLNPTANSFQIRALCKTISNVHAQAVESAVKELKAERDQWKLRAENSEALRHHELQNFDALKKERDGAVIGLATEIQMELERFTNENAGPYMPLIGKLWAICNKARMGGVKDA